MCLDWRLTCLLCIDFASSSKLVKTIDAKMHIFPNLHVLAYTNSTFFIFKLDSLGEVLHIREMLTCSEVVNLPKLLN